MKLIDFVTFMQTNNLSNIVWLWSECPFDEKWSLGHGGDEDFVIISRPDSMSGVVVDKLKVCDTNSMSIEGTDYFLNVTAHA